MHPSHVTRPSFSDLGLTHTSQECFNLQNTNSSGALPTELGQLRVIDTFSVKYNTLTGTLPTEIGCMTTLEKNLNFEDNQLTGEIPTEIGMLTDGVAGTLANFSFAKNSFNGTIPTSISSFVTYEGQIHFEENELCANNKTAVFGPKSGSKVSESTFNPLFPGNASGITSSPYNCFISLSVSIRT